MKYTVPIFRPPVEANTLLLQVTVGCAHNSCRFCTMYRSVKFKAEKIHQIEQDLKEARRMYPGLNRIFLVNGDAFVLSANKLAQISEKIIEYFPEMETITMYASINNIKAKTDEELEMLRDLRINKLYIGLETGIADVVENINKGYTQEEAEKQLERLNKISIRHRSLLMLGVAGKDRGIENAEKTARFLNKVKPDLIWVGTLALFEGSEMLDDVKKGKFNQATEREILEEEKHLIEKLELENVPFYAVHPTNSTSIQGMLPQDKNRIKEMIDNTLKYSNAAVLDSVMERSTL